MSDHIHPRLDGYFEESRYISQHHREFTPHHIAGALAWHGFSSAPLRKPFRLLDIGCGDGIGLCLIAAAYPDAHFVGIDAMPEHIEQGQAFAAHHGINNVELVCQTFSQFLDAPQTDVGLFDYITAQGVIAWVSAEHRREVFEIVASHLAADGVFAVGYNAQPGWQDKLSAQQILLRFLGAQTDKSSSAFTENLELMEKFAAAGAKSLSASGLASLKELVDLAPHDYLLHEYLNQGWQPLWFGEVHHALASRGLRFATHGRFNRLRDDFCLRKAQRELLAGIDDVVQRQTAMDLLQDIQFRTDLFVGSDLEARHSPPKTDVCLMAVKPKEQVEFSCLTLAGRLRFDNPAAHEVLSALEQAPQSLAQINEQSDISEADLINAVETLLVASLVQPVAEPLSENPASALNQFLIEDSVEPSRYAMNGLVSRHGSISIKEHDWQDLRADDEQVNVATKRRLGL